MRRIIILTFTLLLMATAANAQLNAVTYKDGSQVLNGFGIKPVRESRDKNGILILPAWKGIDDHSKETALKLAGLGYAVFIADIYGEGNYPGDDAAAAGKKAGYYKQNVKEYQKRINLALSELIKLGANANNVVVIGYCFGGTGALEAARAGLAVKGVVSFHGGLAKDPKRPNEPIAAKVLVLHGADDPYESPAEISAFQQEMNESKADWQMIYYSGAVHAFTDPYAGSDNSKGAAYNAKAASRSWLHMLDFLKEVLK